MIMVKEARRLKTLRVLLQQPSEDKYVKPKMTVVKQLNRAIGSRAYLMRYKVWSVLRTLFGFVLKPSVWVKW